MDHMLGEATLTAACLLGFGMGAGLDLDLRGLHLQLHTVPLARLDRPKAAQLGHLENNNLDQRVESLTGMASVSTADECKPSGFQGEPHRGGVFCCFISSQKLWERSTRPVREMGLERPESLCGFGRKKTGCVLILS